jgi:hypothetical protein
LIKSKKPSLFSTPDHNLVTLSGPIPPPEIEL